MARGFLPYSIDQRLLLPPDMRAWLPEDHLALFLSDVVDTLDLSAIYLAYDKNDDPGGFRRFLCAVWSKSAPNLRSSPSRTVCSSSFEVQRGRR